MKNTAMNNLDHVHRFLLGENNVAYIQATCYRQCLKEDTYINYTRN